MRKRVAIPLSIFLGLLFWFIVLAIIGSRMEPPQRQQQVEQPETVSQTARKPEPEAPQSVVTEPQQVVTPESDTKPQITQAKSENILLRTNLIEAPVVNGFGEKIGTWAYITLPQDVLLEVVTLDDVAEFYQSFQGKGYNRVSIMCPEGTGLVFGRDEPMASYGPLDKFGRMAGDTHWTIIYDETIGTFRELKIR
jgi:hypothetical protein